MAKHMTAYDGAGIYALYNIVDNKIYIGKASNVKKRFQSHVRAFCSNSKLNAMYSENIDNFTFIILHKLGKQEYEEYGEVLEQLYMIEAKQHYIELYNTKIVTNDSYFRYWLQLQFGTESHLRKTVYDRCGMMPYNMQRSVKRRRLELLQVARENE